jgi:hypothetical protein
MFQKEYTDDCRVVGRATGGDAGSGVFYPWGFVAWVTLQRSEPLIKSSGVVLSLLLLQDLLSLLLREHHEQAPNLRAHAPLSLMTHNSSLALYNRPFRQA